jgi:hypothetical protein
MEQIAQKGVLMRQTNYKNIITGGMGEFIYS